MPTFTSLRTASCRSGGWLALLILLLTSPAAFAQLSGAYTINSAQPTAGTNYASFTAAAAALNAGGVSGPVTFTVSGGPYTEQLVLTQFTGSSATNRVTFNGGGATIQFGSNNANLPAVVVLNGADYVTVNNLTIDAMVGGTSTSTYGWGVQLFNNADNCTISNCTIITSSTVNSNNYQGIVSSATATGTAGTLTNQNLTLSGNTVTGGYYSILIAGSNSTTALTPGIVLLNNNVRDFYFYGIYLSYLTGPQIIGNDISRPLRTSVATFYGLQLGTGISGATVERNRIHHAYGAAPGSANGAYCIYTVSGTTATTTAPNDIVNNLVYEIRTNGTVYGIYNSFSSNIRCYHNTLALDDATSSGTGPSYGLYQSNGVGVEFKNNIVSINRAGSGSNYALYIPNATGSTASNYNDLTGGNNFITGYYNGTSYPTLANWRTAFGGGFDQNSVAADPQYAGVATGDLRPSAMPLDGTATPLARVPTDFTGAMRSTTAPDMGAYEFTPASNDVALQSIDSPVAPVTAGTRTVTVTVRNNGTVPLTSVRLEYVLNGGTAVAQTFALSTALATGATVALSFSTQGTLVAGSNTLTVTGSLPNGQPDSNPGNNTLTATVNTALSGTYTINKLLPTAGTNFTSFTDAGRLLTAAGISASVRFNVLNGPYTEQFAIGVVPGVSATDTVVVDGGTSKQTISYSGTGAQPGAVQLNGSDYVTIQNLTIDVSATTYGIGVHLVGQANNNRVSGCVITAPSLITMTTANAGIAASGGTGAAGTAGDANGLRIENNVISGGYFGIIVTGASLTSRATGLRITGNEVREFYSYGISAENTAGARLISNNLYRTTRLSIGAFYGIFLVGNVGMAVERNRIHDPYTVAPTVTIATYAIYCSNNDGLAGQENDFVNNLVYGLNGGGTEYMVYSYSSDYNRFYHNTFVSDNQSVTSANMSYGFYQNSLATGLDLRNNIFQLTRTGTGVHIALAFTTTTSTIVSNYNDLYLGTGVSFVTGSAGGSSPSLADWQAATGYDLASVAANPAFVAGTWQPTASQLNGAGLTLARVPRDFAGVLRSSPPDIGAYEFTPAANDVALVSIDSPTTPASAITNPVTVTIRNAGALALSTVTLSYSLNGGAAVAQVFTLAPALASAATRQLTFTTGVVPLFGSNTLTVTASLPNAQPDPTPADNVLTLTFSQPIPGNDEPCGAVALGTSPLTSSTSGASTSIQSGISTPACAGGALPKDVWFTFVPAGSSTTLTLTGSAAGAVRVFTSPSCSAGPFGQVFCASSGANNTAFAAPVVVTGLVAGTRYYVAVSGYGSSDVGGAFTIAATALLASPAAAGRAALAVFPNPSATGQLTLQVARPLGTGTVELLNALGQVVHRQALAAGTGEQAVPTTGLAPGIYTLRIRAGAEVLTRQVVLQ